nr:metal-binding protein [arsenite-oxidising bacterium NT-25]
MRKNLVFASVAAVAVAGTIALTALSSAHSTDQPSTSELKMAGPSKSITIWRDPGCGCCDTYAGYLEARGYDVDRVDDRNFVTRSIEAGVPKEGIGCHLAQIDGYYVSGLVPADIIERLVTERPDIKGIALPGMPANAPGMAPEKTGTLKTYAFGEGGVSVYSNE